MEFTQEILEKLNDEQKGPVLQTEGPVLVLAGAGSGKTRVLTSRIAYLVEEKRVPASAILAITFTNKAANEMKERLAKILDIRGMWVCTIHSMCVKILRDFAEEAGITKTFSIYSETERNNIIKKSFQECDFDDEKLLKTLVKPEDDPIVKEYEQILKDVGLKIKYATNEENLNREEKIIISQNPRHTHYSLS